MVTLFRAVGQVNSGSSAGALVGLPGRAEGELVAPGHCGPAAAPGTDTDDSGASRLRCRVDPQNAGYDRRVMAPGIAMLRRLEFRLTRACAGSR